MTSTNAQMVLNAAAPDSLLPQSKPLTLTTNFGWVVGVCLAALVTMPLLIAWTASVVLN